MWKKWLLWAIGVILLAAIVYLIWGIKAPAQIIEEVEIGNPASAFCISQGGTLEIVTDEEGNEIGLCTLVSGEICEEWAYFRGECGTDELEEMEVEEMEPLSSDAEELFANYVGLDLEAAQEYAEAEGRDFRVVSMDGELQPVTMDLREGRINAYVENGVVVDIDVETMGFQIFDAGIEELE